MAPKDEAFKNRGNRERPSDKLWEAGAIDYLPQRFERIKKTEHGYLLTVTTSTGEETKELTEEEFKEKGLKTGTFIYYYGCPFPRKCLATADMIVAIDPVKRRFINTIKFLALLPKKGRLQRFCEYFNSEADVTLSYYYLEGYYSDIATEIQNFVRTFLVSLGVREDIASKTAEIIGAFFEFDNAYRYRVNDILDAARPEALLKNFRKEIKRLLTLAIERDRTLDVAKVKMEAIVKVLNIIWLIPRVRTAIKKGIKAMNWENVKLSEADIYHTLLFKDYDTRGVSLEDRTKKYLAMYPNQKDAPPRVLIRNKH